MAVILIIDNFDSFTYNLVHYVQSSIASIRADMHTVVVRNTVSLDDLKALRPDGIVLSPGPGKPEDAGVTIAAIGHFGSMVPVLGVCLGHQCMASFAGARVSRSLTPTHGKTAEIFHDGKGVFHGLNSPIRATRYHSLMVENSSLPPRLIVSARTRDSEIMGLRLEGTQCEGVQFHPESILTPDGMHMIGNFVRRVVAARTG